MSSHSDDILLTEELDLSVEENANQLWIDEAQSRSDAYLRGEFEALPGDEVMARVRDRLKLIE